MSKRHRDCPESKETIAFRNKLRSFSAAGQKTMFSHSLHSLTDEIEESIRAVLLNNWCLGVGKFLFEPDKQSKKMNEAIFSSHLTRKQQENLWLQFVELNFRNSYLLLSCYVESILNRIKNMHEDFTGSLIALKKIKFSKYPEDFFDKENSVFIRDSVESPRFIKIVNFIRLVANTIKHENAVIANGNSAKVLIRDYKMPKGVQMTGLMGFSLRADRYSVKTDDIGKLTLMTYIFLTDLLSNVFSVPRMKEKGLDQKRLCKKILRESLRKNVVDALHLDLAKDGLVAPYSEGK